MSARRVKCPNCGGVLSLPGDIRNCSVRCGLCRRAFRLPKSIPVPEDTITGWLHRPEDDEDEDERVGTLAPLSDGRPKAATKSASKRRRATGLGDQLRLVSLERRGAMFEFPTEYLRRSDFRCAIPRVCIHCLGRAHLSAHLIIFAPQLRDSISLEAEHKAGGLRIPQEQLGDLGGEELLNRLPEVPSVPAPGNLPMPYWVCNLCSGEGEISGQIQVDASSGRGHCRLYVRNIQVASSFLAAVAGTNNPDHARFVEFARHAREDLWDALPTVVHHRLEQWFKPTADERFLAYVPDRTHSQTEDGMAGLVVSTRRLIYHRVPVHQELPVTSQLTIQVRASKGKKKVAIVSAANFKPRPITLDRQGEITLRRVLYEGHFKALWR